MLYLSSSHRFRMEIMVWFVASCMDLPKGLYPLVGTPSGLYPTRGAPKPKRYRARRLASLVAQATSPASRPPRLCSASPNSSPRQPHRLAGLLPQQATSLAVSPTTRPIQRTDPPRGLYPEIGAPSGLYPTSDLRCPSSVEHVLQEDLVIQIELVPNGLVPLLPPKRIDSG